MDHPYLKEAPAWTAWRSARIGRQVAIREGATLSRRKFPFSAWLPSISGLRNSATDVAFSPQGDRIATVDSSVGLWEIHPSWNVGTHAF